jgi:hypothetical protein
VAQLYPQALGSLVVASNDLQDCSEGIRTRVHKYLELDSVSGIEAVRTGNETYFKNSERC